MPKTTLKLGEIESLLNAHYLLDGTGGRRGDATFKPFKFKRHDQVAYRVARNIRVLNDEFKDVNERRKTIFREIEPDENVTSLTGLKEVEFISRMATVLAEQVEVELRSIDVADLDMASNAIPASILADLMPVLTGDPDTVQEPAAEKK